MLLPYHNKLTLKVSRSTASRKQKRCVIKHKTYSAQCGLKYVNVKHVNDKHVNVKYVNVKYVNVKHVNVKHVNVKYVNVKYVNVKHVNVKHVNVKPLYSCNLLCIYVNVS